MNEHIQELQALHHEGRLIPFVGAGLSRMLGAPSFSELVAELAKARGFDSDVFLKHGPSNQLASYLIDRANRGALIPRMTKILETANSTELREKSEIHRLLAEGGFKRIYTTNYDTHIEEAFKQHGKKMHVVASKADLSKAPSDVTWLVKFHGDLTQPATIVFSEDDYFRRLRFDDPLDLLLRADSLSNGFLFLGYSFEDSNVRYLWYRLREIDPGSQSEVEAPHPAAGAWLAATSPGEVQAKLLSELGIQLVSLDPVERKASLIDVLRQVLEASG